MQLRKKLPAALLLAALLMSLALPVCASDAQDCGAKLLAITFDDGPGKYTGELLDGLAERGIHATFFVNGVNAAAWPETLKRIADEGHQLANHTYNHKNLNTCDAATVRREIDGVQSLITAAGGSENAYIRAPYGNANKTVKSVVTAPLIYWSVDPEDWKYRDAETVRKNIEAGVFDGAIILVHDIYKTSVDGALAAIDDLTAEGYEFVTVEELLLRRGVTPTAATVYYSAKNTGVNLPADEVGEQAYDETQLEQHWGYGAMRTCLHYGWMETAADGRWKPNKYVTRAEFAADLARFAGIHATYPTDGAAVFSDVDIAGADAPYISWASGCGILQGYPDGTFRPDATLTREQMAAILARYYALRGAAAEGSADGFADAAKISAWAKESVGACVSLGLVMGDARGRFLPRGKLTRAQIATILVRMAG